MANEIDIFFCSLPIDNSAIPATTETKPMQHHHPAPNRWGIAPEKLYPLKHLQVGIGLGKDALRSMRQAGLPVIYHGRAGYVVGADLIAHITKEGTKTRPQGRP